MTPSEIKKWSDLNPRPMGDTDQLVDQGRLDEYYRQQERDLFCPVGKMVCAQYGSSIRECMDMGASHEDASLMTRDDCESGFSIPGAELPSDYVCGIERVNEAEGEVRLESEENDA